MTTTELNQKQLEWLELITGAQLDAWNEKAAARDGKLTELRAKVDGIKGRLDASFDYRLIGKESKGWLFTSKADDLTSKTEKQDAMKELDVVHDDLSQVEGIEDKDAFDAALAYEELERLKEELKAAVGPDGEPLFDDADVMRELYTPLVREGVMSENQVPDKYSEVANVFNKSAELYNKRLEDFSKTRTWKDDLKDDLKLASGLVQDAASVAGSITDALGNKDASAIVSSVRIGLQAGLKVTENALDASVADGIDVVAKATGDIVSLFVSKDIGAIVKKSVAASSAATKVARALKDGKYGDALAALGDSVAAATTAADPNNSNGAQDIGGKVSTALAAASNVAALREAVVSGDPARITAALGGMAKTAAGAYTSTLTVPKPDNELTAEDKARNKAVADLTANINVGIDMGVAGAQAARAGYKAATGDGQGAIDSLSEAANSAMKAGKDRIDAKAKAEEAQKKGAPEDPAETDPHKKRLAEIKAANEATQAGQEEEFKLSDDLVGQLKAAQKYKPPTKEDKKAAEAGAKKAEAEGDKAQMEAATAEFRSMLEMSVGGRDPEMDPEAQKLLAAQFDIDKLIAQMQADAAVLAAAETIFNAAGGVVTALVPQLAAMKAGKDFLKNVVMAAQRAIELNKFVESLNDASSAVSAYADAIKKRVADTRTQLTNHTIEAILQAAIAVGAALASTGAGPLAVGGAVVQKVAEGSKGVKDLILRIATEAELASAWKLYQKALATPLDRKVKRMAMATNPTLSKYAMAYGAYVQGDAIAKDIVRKCGLNEEVLANPSTNVGKVVKFLELRFNEDQVLLRTVSAPRKWMKGAKVELTIESWLSIKALARTEIKLAAGGEAGIERYLVALGGCAYSQAKAPTKEQKDEYATILADLQKAARAYAPVDAEKKPLADMISVRDELAVLAGQEIQLVQALA